MARPRSLVRAVRGRGARLRPRRHSGGAARCRAFREGGRRGRTRRRRSSGSAWRALIVRRRTPAERLTRGRSPAFAASAAAMARGVRGCSGGRCNSRRTRLRPTVARLPAAAPRFPQPDSLGLWSWEGGYRQKSVLSTPLPMCISLNKRPVRGLCRRRARRGLPRFHGVRRPVPSSRGDHRGSRNRCYPLFWNCPARHRRSGIPAVRSRCSQTSRPRSTGSGSRHLL